MIGHEMIGNTLGIVMNLSLTVVIIGVVFVLLGGYFWSTSKGRSVSLVLGIVVASVLYTAIVGTPFFQSVFPESIRGFILDTTIFSLLVFLATYITHSYVHGKFASDTSKKILHVSLLAIVTEGVIFSIGYNMLDFDSFYNFSPFADIIFDSAYSFFLWLIALCLILFLIRSRR